MLILLQQLPTKCRLNATHPRTRNGMAQEARQTRRLRYATSTQARHCSRRSTATRRPENARGLLPYVFYTYIFRSGD